MGLSFALERAVPACKKNIMKFVNFPRKSFGGRNTFLLAEAIDAREAPIVPPAAPA
jgi:hypothetical protein